MGDCQENSLAITKHINETAVRLEELEGNSSYRKYVVKINSIADQIA